MVLVTSADRLENGSEVLSNVVYNSLSSNLVQSK